MTVLGGCISLNRVHNFLVVVDMCHLLNIGQCDIEKQIHNRAKASDYANIQIRLSSRTVPSREVPGRSRDGTGQDQDLETLKVPWSRQDRT